ncbi:MAG: flippase-like domain-containing protein [Chitinophagaceae bacterium]|nr:flippase-like domain-containing protein [Chitinophagaceae bacterium]
MVIQNKNIKIIFNRVIGPVLFVWLSYTIYRQILEQPDLSQSLQHIKSAAIGPGAWKCGLVILLMGLNWLIEACKWKILVEPLEPISLARSLKAVMVGVAFGMGTPNRVGEFGGRAFYMSEGKRMSALSFTMIGSLGQLLTTLFFGSMGIFIIQPEFPGWSAAASVCIVITTLLFFCLYFRLEWIVRIANVCRLPEKFIRPWAVIKTVNVTILLRVLALSVIRYIIFLAQYILLLELVEVSVGWWNGFWLISILYLILALVPTMALLELGIRGKAGILLFHTVSANTAGIYAASVGIWMINLALPALIGSWVVVRHKFFNVKR